MFRETKERFQELEEYKKNVLSWKPFPSEKEKVDNSVKGYRRGGGLS